MLMTYLVHTRIIIGASVWFTYLHHWLYERKRQHETWSKKESHIIATFLGKLASCAQKFTLTVFVGRHVVSSKVSLCAASKPHILVSSCKVLQW